jgi:LCP family protein required for cell wall assembly
MRRADYRYLRHGDTYVRRLLRALLSALIPGAGQIVAGTRRRGCVMLAVAILLLIAGVVIGLQGVDLVLSWVIQPSVLLGLLVLNVALLAFRLFAVVDAYRTPEAGSRVADVRSTPPDGADGLSTSQTSATQSSASKVLAGAGLVALLLITIAPHAAAGYYTYLSRDLLTTVFVDEEATTSTSTSLPLPTTTSVPTVASTSTTAATSTSLTTSTTQAPPDTTPAIEVGDDQRLTILLIGSDAGYGRTGSRADSIMVATLDLQTGQAALFGIPRNTGSVPLSGAAANALGTEVYVDLISSLYSDARDHPELAPQGKDPGAVVLRDAVSKLLDIPVDYYAVVDMGGFVDLVDAFGGVTLNVKTRVRVRISPPTPDGEWKIYDIEPGKRHLSGLEALAFARSRTGADDYARMHRQRCVLAGLLYQNGPAEMLLKFPKIVKAIQKSLRTDIPIDRLRDLIKIRSKIQSDELITVGFTPPDYITGRNEMGYNILNLKLVQATVRQIIEHPEEVPKTQATDMNVDGSDCWKID